MSYLALIFMFAFSIPCESAALNKRQSPDDLLMTLFRKQELLLQQVEKQVNDKISALDSKITNQIKNSESALMKEMQCPRGFFGNDFGCYKFIYETLSHDDATTRCRQDHSHLVELQSKEESDGLIALMDQRVAKHNYYHLGGKKVKNAWTWSESKKPFTFTNWYPGQPQDNEECAAFPYWPGAVNHKKWFDNDCVQIFYAVCEI